MEMVPISAFLGVRVLFSKIQDELIFVNGLYRLQVKRHMTDRSRITNVFDVAPVFDTFHWQGEKTIPPAMFTSTREKSESPRRGKLNPVPVFRSARG